jgi:hypothetical protein
MKKQLFFFTVLLCISVICFPQTKFRSGIFMHHSTGDNIWGPNGSTTSIPLEMTKYNTTNGYTGADAVNMTSSWWPDGVNSGNNEWYYWHNIFENKDLTNSDIRPILSANKIIVIKSCFPSSDIDSRGHASDTLSPQNKTIYNYKWHWRHIVKVMKKHPENFFAIWTNAPKVAGQTDAAAAGLSKSFCKWAKDTLAKGLDPVIGSFPKNIFVFDYFAKLTDATGYLKSTYAVSSSDSHPNASATALIAPQFVSEIFGAAILYETTTSIPENKYSGDCFIFPNPAKESINVRTSQYGDNCLFSIYSMTGEKILSMPLTDYQTPVNIASLNRGVYFVKLTYGKLSVVRKLIKE